MRYSTKPRERIYIKEFGFSFFARRFCDKHGTKIKDTAKKGAKSVGMDAAKTVSKRVVQKTAETTDNLIGKKIK